MTLFFKRMLKDIFWMKSSELIDKAKAAHAERKTLKLEEKTSEIVAKKGTKIKSVVLAEKKVQNTTDEVDQIVNNMKFAALLIKQINIDINKNYRSLKYVIFFKDLLVE